ncbi:MAG: hypothetical protein MSC31_08160 [Solirubrobacteraceae bacterium MAG38_C4-C5]|nr:hypothetical protein [Candidatus Siliceabacter maunaloa]
MIDVGRILDEAGDTLGQFLPRLGAALLILLGGWLVSRLFCRLLVRALQRVGLDRAAERVGLHDLLVRAGLERSLTRLIGLVVRVTLLVIVVVATIGVLGIDALDRTLDEVLLFLPRLLVALVLLLGGLVLSSVARERVERAAYQMDLPGPLGRVTQVSVLVIAAITALGQLGVPTLVLNVLVAAVASGAVLTFAIAFGLGGREVARQLSAGRALATTYEEGQTIAVGGLRGAIVSLDDTTVVLDVDDGRRVRIPNHVLLEGTVTVREVERST